MLNQTEAAAHLFLETKAGRSDYGSQFEILVSLLYHGVCKPGDFVVDGGANAGLHAVPLAGLVGRSGHLYCFEPNPTIVFGLVKHLLASGGLNNCSIHAQALGDHDGLVEFHINETRPALSHISFKPEENLTKVTVRCCQLDKVIGDNKIGFLKLDLEGADFLAINGARNIIERDRPPLIFENSRAWAAKCYGYTMEDFFRFFDGAGYRVYDLHGRLLTSDKWKDPNFAFEYLAIHGDDTRIGNLLKTIRNFWGTVEKRPVMEKWEQCMAACQDPVGYMASCGL